MGPLVVVAGLAKVRAVDEGAKGATSSDGCCLNPYFCAARLSFVPRQRLALQHLYVANGGTKTDDSNVLGVTFRLSTQASSAVA